MTPQPLTNEAITPPSTFTNKAPKTNLSWAAYDPRINNGDDFLKPKIYRKNIQV